MTLPYQSLRNVNVKGMITSLKAAIESGSSFHFVSTIGAVPLGILKEEWITSIPPDMNSKDGYSQSKVVCELILNKIKDLFTISIQIFRPSAICGDSRSGYCNFKDFGSLVLKVIVDIGSYVEGGSTSLRWIPVDFVAKAIAQSLLDSRRIILNLFGKGPQWSLIYQRLVNEGFSIKPIDRYQWKKLVQKSIEEGHEAEPMIEEISSIEFNDTRVDALNTDYSRDYLLEQGLEWPTIDKSIIDLMLTFMKDHHFLKQT
jgi:thioester reductase-like protein